MTGGSLVNGSSLRRQAISCLALLLLAIGANFAFPSIAHAAFAGGIYIEAVCDILALLKGELGGFLFAGALLMGMIIAVTGNSAGIKVAIAVAVACYAGFNILSMHEAFQNVQCANSGDGAAPPPEAPAPTRLATTKAVIAESGSPIAFNPDFAQPDEDE